MRARDSIETSRAFERFLKRHGFSTTESKTIVALAWNEVAAIAEKRGRSEGRSRKAGRMVGGAARRR